MIYNRDIDIIIPAYNVPENVLFRCLSSIACQSIIDDIEITIIDDASESEYIEIYKNVIDKFKNQMKINLLRYETNGGPGVARQYGIDHTSNGYMMFIDADDTLNGAFACAILRNAIESDNGRYVMASGAFDEIHDSDITDIKGPVFVPHEQDLIWMFGKIYKRSFIDKYSIRFHETSRANEDNGFNTIIRLLSNEEEQISFVSAHVYYWHENLNSITRANDYQYCYGGSNRDSFYGYVENMIHAINKSKKECATHSHIMMWTLDCMLNLYEYYIEAYARARDHADANFESCKRFYKEAYKQFEDQITEEMFITQYNEMMRGAYMGNKLVGIIPHMTINQFLEEIKKLDM